MDNIFPSPPPQISVSSIHKICLKKKVIEMLGKIEKKDFLLTCACPDTEFYVFSKTASFYVCIL